MRMERAKRKAGGGRSSRPRWTPTRRGAATRSGKRSSASRRSGSAISPDGKSGARPAETPTAPAAAKRRPNVPPAAPTSASKTTISPTRSVLRFRPGGNVVIRKRGVLITSRIECHDLTVYGKVAGKITCTGTVRFKTSGRVIGEIRCNRLIVEKAVEYRIPPADPRE